MALDESEVERLANLGKMVELKKEFLKLTTAEQDALRNSTTLAQRYIDILDMAAANVRVTTIELENQKLALEDRIRLETDSYTNQLRERELRKTIAEIGLNELDDLREKMRIGQELLPVEAQRLKDLEKQEDALKRQVRAIDRSKDGVQDTSGALRQMNPMAVKLADKFAEIAESAQDGSLAAKGLAAAGGVANSVLSKVFNVVKDAVFGLDEATNAFERQYQMGPQYTAAITDLYGEMNELSVSAEEVGSAYGAMISTFTDFTMLSDQQQRSLATTASLMAEVGVSNQDFAQSTQNMSKFFGVAADDMGTQMGDLTAMARELGVPTGELAGNFARAGGSLAKFGSQGIKAFKDLSRISKLTGMEMEKVLNITNRFDTFEGAAEMAGQLNAALGGNFVNAMDMMTETDPAARFEMVRDAIMQTGLSFDDMSYYQKQFYTEALGLSDVGDLALMMSGRMDMLSGATDASAESLIEQRERAQNVQSIMEKMQAVLVDNADGFLFLADLMSRAVTALQEYGHLIPTIIKLMVAFKIASFALALAQMSLGVANQFNASTGLKAGISLTILAGAIAAIVLAMMIMSPSKVVLALFSMGAALFVLGKIGPSAAAGLQAVAIPLLQIGAGVFLVTIGVAAMAAAFSLLSVSQMVGLGVALVGIGVGLYFLAPALTATGAAALAATPGLGGISLIVLAIGGAVFLAATGVGLMAEGLGHMFASIDLEKMVAFGVFVGALVLGAPYMGIAGLGLGAMALGMGALGLSLKIVATRDLEAIAQFATGLAALEVEKVAKLADALKEVANAMDSIPTYKAITMSATLQSAKMAAEAARILIGQGGLNNTNQRTQAAAAAGGGEVNVHVTLELDGEVLDKRIVKTTERAQGSGGPLSAIANILG